MNSSWIVVFVGGGIGSVLRFFLQQQLNSTKPADFPLGTFCVNLVGCLLIGLLWGWSEKSSWLTTDLKFFLFTGPCGGFTTFSAFSQESLQLLKVGAYQPLLIYVMGTLLASFLLTYLGYKLIS